MRCDNRFFSCEREGICLTFEELLRNVSKTVVSNFGKLFKDIFKMKFFVKPFDKMRMDSRAMLEKLSSKQALYNF